MPDTIRPEFDVHMLNDEGKKKARDIAEGFSTLLTMIENMIPQSRARSIAITHLQDACFWTKRGMAELPENQQEK